MNKQQPSTNKKAYPSAKNDEEQAESSVIPFDLLTLHDRKSSFHDPDLLFNDKDQDSYFSTIKQLDSHCACKHSAYHKKGKPIQKRQKQPEDDKKMNLNRRRRMAYLQSRVQELEKEVHSLRRSEHYCMNCRERLPGYYRERICEIIQPEDPAPGGAAEPQYRRTNSKDSFEFENIDFHTPLMQTQEMQEKMWIFLGTMLIAMGSKVMDFDGTINNFKVLKDSVDRVRRQVQKGQTSLGMQFFCSKQQLNEPGSLIDGVNFDPFYSMKEDPAQGHFCLQGVKVQSVQQYELFYDYKYKFNIKYDALLTIMEYARDNCALS